MDVEAQISQGDWVPGPGEDSLTAVLGREHPGRTRGVGHTVGVRKAMLGFDQNKKKMQDKEAMDEMRAKMENMTNRMEDMTNQITLLKTMIQESRKQVDVNVSSEVQNGSRDSTSALDSIMVFVYTCSPKFKVFFAVLDHDLHYMLYVCRTLPLVNWCYLMGRWIKSVLPGWSFRTGMD